MSSSLAKGDDTLLFSFTREDDTLLFSFTRQDDTLLFPFTREEKRIVTLGSQENRSVLSPLASEDGEMYAAAHKFYEVTSQSVYKYYYFTR